MADPSKQEPTKSEPVRFVAEQLPFWHKHRLSILMIIAVTAALILTVVSVMIYNTSGAAQLDLSRPGYRAVSDKVDKKQSIDTYSASGPVTKDSIQEFIKLYDRQSEKAKAVDAFNGDPLNPEVLEFGSHDEEE